MRLSLCWNLLRKKDLLKKNSSSLPFWTMDMDKDETVPPNRWPVPEPYWCHRDNLPEDISVFAPNGHMLYGYREGKMVQTYSTSKIHQVLVLCGRALHHLSHNKEWLLYILVIFRVRLD